MTSGSGPYRVPAHTTITTRRARRAHRCSYCRVIEPGETYLLHTAYPGHECVDVGGRPDRLPECSNCATRDGRGDLLAAPSGTVHRPSARAR